MAFTFENTSNDDEYNTSCFKMTLDKEDQEWPELTEYFLQFLRGCGYVLTAQDFVEYVNSVVEDHEDMS